MSYRKLNADRLFTGLTWLSDQHVLVLKEDGTVEEIVAVEDAGDDIVKMPGILSPGFVNCHCHLELSHMKGIIPKGSGMLSFINSVMGQRAADSIVIETAMEEAELEMRKNGIVAVGDICNTALSLSQKRKGNLYYHNFIEVSGFVPSTAAQRMVQGVEIFNQFAQQYGLPIDSNSIVPHAPYSVSTELLETIVNFPGNHLLSIHNQESIAEKEFFIHKKGDFLKLYDKLGIDLSFWEAPGASGLQTILPKCYSNQTLILVHNVNLSANDIQFIHQSQRHSAQQIYCCLCPNANLYIGNGLPDIDLLISSELPILLGTDSLASNSQLSIWEEIKTIQTHFPHLSLEQILPWATINGACALDMDSILGSFEKGKQPGVVVIEGGECERVEYRI